MYILTCNFNNKKKEKSVNDQDCSILFLFFFLKLLENKTILTILYIFELLQFLNFN